MKSPPPPELPRVQREMGERKRWIEKGGERNAQREEEEEEEWEEEEEEKAEREQ